MATAVPPGQALTGLLTACSSTSKPGVIVPPDPVASCTVADCASALNAQMKQGYGADSSGADKLGAHYNQCMTDLDSLACGDALPADCAGVILFYP